MKRWISLILTAALCTSMCCIYAEDAVLGTSDEAQSIVLQEGFVADNGGGVCFRSGG